MVDDKFDCKESNLVLFNDVSKFLLLLSTLFCSLLIAIYLVNKKITNYRYSEAIQNKAVVNSLEYAVKNNIDCSNNQKVLACHNIQIELRKTNVKISVNKLFSMYYDLTSSLS